MLDIGNIKSFRDILQVIPISIKVVNERQSIRVRKRMALLLMVVDNPFFATWSRCERSGWLQRRVSWHQLYR
jgi:hypothetical protein